MTPFHCHLPLTQTSVHLLPGVKHHTRNIILVSSWKVTFRHTETLPQGCGSGLLPRWRAHRATVAVWQRCLSWQGNGQHWGRVTARHTHTHAHSPSLTPQGSAGRAGGGALCVCDSVKQARMTVTWHWWNNYESKTGLTGSSPCPSTICQLSLT